MTRQRLQPVKYQLGPSHISQPDIEIYVKRPTAEQMKGWLGEKLDTLEMRNQSAKRQAYLTSWQRKDFSIIVLPKVQSK